MSRQAETIRPWQSGRRKYPLAVVVASLTWAGVSPATGQATELADLVATMQSNTWAELPSSGLSAALDTLTDGADHNILTYSQGGRTWNPTTGEIFFIGGDHNGGHERFIKYNAAANAWSTLPDPPFFGNLQRHSYSWNCIDVNQQRFLYQRREYDIANGVWSDLPTSGTTSVEAAHDSYEYMEGVGYFRAADGDIRWLVDGASSWTTPSSITITGLHHNSNYSSVKNVAIFGGGNDNNPIQRLNSDQTVDTLGPAPLTISVHPSKGIMTSDPVSGNFLHLETDYTFRQFDPIADTWSVLPSPTVLTGVVNNMAFFPISTLGVIVLIEWLDVGSAKMWVYKAGDPPPKPKNPTELVTH